jgi:uncharacterized protein (DUF362 family)
MREMNRRRFLASAGAVPGLIAAGRLLHAATPSLSIAHYKTSPAEADGIAEEAKRLTRAAIEALGGMGRFVSKGHVVWVKPNIGWDRRPEQAACTNPDVVATLIEMCFKAGAKKVVVSDNPCNRAERTFPRSGIQEAAEKAGAECYFMDERKFRQMSIKGAVSLKDWQIYQDVVECDRIINVPIVKNHELSVATLGMKNLMGVAGGSRSRFHQDMSKVLVDIAGFIKPQLVVLDAVRVLTANGPTGGNLADVKRKDTIVAGVDQVAVDAFGATILGLKPADIGVVVEGHRRGLGTMDYQSLTPVRLEI